MPDTVVLPDRLEVTRPIAGTPAAIFDILRSPAGHVAIDASGMLQDEPDESLRKKCEEAAELCPTGAITIEG